MKSNPLGGECRSFNDMSGNRERSNYPSKGCISPMMTSSFLPCSNKEVTKNINENKYCPQNVVFKGVKGEKSIYPRLSVNNVKENDMLILYTSNRK